LGLFEYGQIGILKETTVAIFDLSIRTFLYRARNYGALLHTHDRYSHAYGAVATVGVNRELVGMDPRVPEETSAEMNIMRAKAPVPPPEYNGKYLPTNALFLIFVPSCFSLKC
jgi:hypothetical protein